MIQRMASNRIFIASITIAGLSLAANGWALIGETAAQSDARYGPAVKIWGDQRNYRKAGFDINVHFYNGLADDITYKKNTLDKHGRPEVVTFEEIAILLDNNSRGQEWKDLLKGYNPSYQPQTKWGCKRFLLQASYDDENKTLDIFAQNFDKLYEIYSRRTKTSQEKLVNTLGL